MPKEGSRPPAIKTLAPSLLDATAMNNKQDLRIYDFYSIFKDSVQMKSVSHFWLYLDDHPMRHLHKSFCRRIFKILPFVHFPFLSHFSHLFTIFYLGDPEAARNYDFQFRVRQTFYYNVPTQWLSIYSSWVDSLDPDRWISTFP